MSLLFRILFVGIILSVLGCSKPSESAFNVIGLSKVEVREKFNEPNNISILTKENFQGYKGPRPKFIKTIRPSEKIEVWSYKVKEGNVHLYFRAGEKVVAKILLENGVMY